MDSTVIILIGAGVLCIAAGFIMFFRLSAKKTDASVKASVLPDDYAANFQECFDGCGSIEETLDELLGIYAKNKTVQKLISEAADYISGGGDYETALEGINADGSGEIAEMHASAIRKALGYGGDAEEENSGISEEEEKPQKKQKKKKTRPSEDEFEEDEEEERPVKKKRRSGSSSGGDGFKI